MWGLHKNKKSKQNHRGNIKIKTAQPQETTTPLETEKCECNVILRLSWENKTQGKQGRSLSVWLTSPALSLLRKFTHHCSASFYNCPFSVTTESLLITHLSRDVILVRFVQPLVIGIGFCLNLTVLTEYIRSYFNPFQLSNSLLTSNYVLYTSEEHSKLTGNDATHKPGVIPCSYGSVLCIQGDYDIHSIGHRKLE